MSSTPLAGGSLAVVADPVVADDRQAWEEKRSSVRGDRKFTAKLVSLGGSSEVRCPVEDLSEGGLYVRAAASYGLAVGQRYQVTLSDDLSCSESENLAGEGCYATVVRTDRVTEESSGQTGAGLRFDHPLFL